VHFNLAEIHAKRGRFPQAAQSYEAALKLRPAEPAIWVAYLMLASRHPNPKNFDILRERAKPLLHKTPPFAYFEGLSRARMKDWTGAIARFETAVSGGFRSAEVLRNYAIALDELDRLAEALAQIDAALELEPQNDVILYQRAEHFRKMGDLASAKTAALKAIDAAPQMGGPYALYVSLGKVAADDPNIARMRKALASKRAGDPDVTTLCAALAKAMEDTGETPQVFRYLKRGNDVAAKAFPYDPDAARDLASRLRDIYLSVAEMPAPTSDTAPIFVLGRLKGVADDFGAQLTKLFPQASHVTDKSISTYSYIGLLHKVMPRARFILVRRDPRDNALSIYKNRFSDGQHRYSNDLRHVAFFLRQFEEFADFWRQHCPHAIFEIQYEDLIADPEAKSRALVAAAGLEWEDACLSFYNAKRRATRPWHGHIGAGTFFKYPCHPAVGFAHLSAPSRDLWGRGLSGGSCTPLRKFVSRFGTGSKDQSFGASE